MEQVDFSPEQEIIIDLFKKDRKLYRDFYLTGGTTLSVYYLNHR